MGKLNRYDLIYSPEHGAFRLYDYEERSQLGDVGKVVQIIRKKVIIKILLALAKGEMVSIDCFEGKDYFIPKDFSEGILDIIHDG